jgi:hypothetical protein
MPRQSRLTLRRPSTSGGENAPTEIDPSDDLLVALLVTVDALSRRWTASQSQAVVSALTGRTQEAAAVEWKPEAISQQAVAQHLSRAHWFAADRSIRAFRAYLGARVGQPTRKSQGTP